MHNKQIRDIDFRKPYWLFRSDAIKNAGTSYPGLKEIYGTYDTREEAIQNMNTENDCLNSIYEYDINSGKMLCIYSRSSMVCTAVIDAGPLKVR